ncbi:hypothetical protein F4680DRAFT_453515 [Xylaria scruposa]|nr:hypothetical protein F4680DRAFT_453515 [Xylaria scruposa]
MATMAPPPTDAKPVKKWDDTMLAHLFLCIYDTIDISFTPENKIAIATMMNERFNHSVNWNGIRNSQPHSTTTVSQHLALHSNFYVLTFSTAYLFTLHHHYNHSAIMSSSRTLMKWDSKVHEDILVAINDVAQLGREDWNHVIQALHGMGYSFTESALK